jgi:hypothetical protein
MAHLYAPSAVACSLPLFKIIILLLVKNQIISREQAQPVIEVMSAFFRPEAASSHEQE